MRQILAALALLVALPAWGANVTPTTGWLTLDGTTALSGDLTIDAGADWFIIYNIDRNLTTGIPACTLDGVSPSHSLSFATGASARHNHWIWLWDAADIAGMTGPATVSGCTASAADTYYIYGAVEATSSTTFADWTGSAADSAGDPAIATCTHTTGDLVIAGAIDEDDTTTITSWESLSELEDVAGDSTRGGFAAGNNAGDGTITVDIAAPTGSSGACLVFADETAGEFSVNPTVTAQDTNDFTLGGTTTAAVTVSAVACAKDSTAPTIAQVAAGNCTGDVAALAAVSESWNGADSFVLGGALTLKIYDLYATDGASLVTLADEQLDVAAGYERTILGAQDPTSVYDGTETASGDYCDTEAVTSPGGYAVTPAADGTLAYDAGADGSRQIILGNCHDLSESDIDSYQFVFNNQSPESDENWPLGAGSLFEVGTDPAITENGSGSVTDAESDDIDWTLESGALPDDWSLAAETGVISDGVPGACGNFTGELGATDAYGALTAIAFDITIGTTVPNVVTGGVDVATGVAAIEAQNAAEGCLLTAAAGTPRYSATVALGDIIETDPAVGTLVVPDQVVAYVESLGSVPIDFWVSYARVWMFKEVRRVYLTTTAFKGAVEDELRTAGVWARWAPGTNAWSGSSNMEINVLAIPGVPPLNPNGTLQQ